MVNIQIANALMSFASMFKNRSKRIANWFRGMAENVSGPDGKLRIIIDDGRVYTRYVDASDMETKYPIKGEYANAAFFFKDISEEVTFDPVLETKEIEGDGNAELAGMDVHSTDYIDMFMQQKTFRDMLFTRARGALDSQTTQYIMLGLIGVILALLGYQFI